MRLLERVICINIKMWFLTILISVLLMIYLACINPPWSLLAKLLVVDDQPDRVDVLIVLEGDSERDLYAAQFYRLGWAPKIIITGCGAPAQKMVIRAVNAGVKAEDIILEEHAKSTYENALFSKEIALSQNFKSAIVVSSPYHMRRTKLVFERLFRNSDIQLLYCSTKESGFNVDGLCKSEIDRSIVKREYIKLIYYWFRYW